MDKLNFIQWLALQTGATIALLGLLGFVFREKWKQLLARSLATDLERLKAELQQQVEAYKVSLIAQAEQAKAQSELRKAIALKHSMNEFDRLVDLEAAFEANSLVLVRARYPAAFKSAEDVELCIKEANELTRVFGRAWMFLPSDLRRDIAQHRGATHQVLTQHVGPGKPNLADDPNDPILRANVRIVEAIRDRIHALGRLDS